MKVKPSFQPRGNPYKMTKFSKSLLLGQHFYSGYKGIGTICFVCLWIDLSRLLELHG